MNTRVQDHSSTVDICLIFRQFRTSPLSRGQNSLHIQPPGLMGTKYCAKVRDFSPTCLPSPYMMKTLSLLVGSNRPVALKLGMEKKRVHKYYQESLG